MPCPGLELWIAFYGGELEEPATRRMALHLQGCSGCQGEFDRLCRLGAAFRDGLASAPRPLTGRPRPLPTVGRRWTPLAAAALFATASVVLVLATQGGSPPAPKRPLARIPHPTPPALRPAAEPAGASAPMLRPASPAPLPPASNPPPSSSGPKELFPVPAAPAPETAFPVPPKATSPEPPLERVLAASRPRPPAARLGTLERLDGDVTVAASGPPSVARQGQAVFAAETWATGGARSRAVLRFADGTRMELGEKTVVRHILDCDGERGVGKRIVLAEGTLSLEVARQPSGRAMVIESPHAEARIVGTVLRLVVEPGERGSTRLEVLEGKVRFSQQDSVIDVFGGFGATAGPAGEWAARPLAKAGVETVFRFTFEDGRLPRCFESGAVERGPERSGNRFCVAGMQVPGATAGGHVTLNDEGRGLFSYSEDLFLEFDYWAGEGARSLDVQVWSRVQQTTFGVTVGNPARGAWTHQVLPLAEFSRPGAGRPIHLKAGEAVPVLWIQAAQVGTALYLDNLELVRMGRWEGRR